MEGGGTVTAVGSLMSLSVTLLVQDTIFAIPEFQHESEELQDPELFKFHPSYDRTWVGKVICFFTANVRESEHGVRQNVRLAFVHWAEEYNPTEREPPSLCVCRQLISQARVVSACFLDTFCARVLPDRSRNAYGEAEQIAPGLLAKDTVVRCHRVLAHPGHMPNCP